jgi:MEMO1 family protein
MQATVRKSAVAGSWYPGTAARIADEVEGYLAHAGPQQAAGRLVGLISPHAGLRYSGPVAAHGYSLLRGRSDLSVVLVGPSHRVAFEGSAVYAAGAWETPLGTIPIDERLAEAIVDPRSGIVDDARPHRDEHSLEMQLPFLQHLVTGLRLVPVMMGSQGRAEVEALAAALAKALRRHPGLLVASSDLSHYHPAAVANALDRKVVDDVERFDADGLMKRLEEAWGHACGGGPMVAVMKTARALGADRASVLCYADSGDAGEHDKGHVVGYLSAALTASAS